LPFNYVFPFDFDTEDLTIRIAFDSTPFAATLRWTDISADVESGTIKKGRQHDLDRIEAGVCTLVVDNASGNYWPDNASGAYYGNLKPGKRINVRKTYGGTTYDVFTGFIESYRPYFPGVASESKIEITAVDLFKNLALTELNERNVTLTNAGNYAYRADNADLSMGDIDFAIAGWFRLYDKSVDRPLVCKSANNTNMEYGLYYDQSVDRFAMEMSSSGAIGGLQQAVGGSSPSTLTWYFVVGQYDAANNNIEVSVNGGSLGSQSHSGGAYNGTSALRVGSIEYGMLSGVAEYNDGWFGPVGIYKKVLTSAQIAALYNNGRWLYYSDLSADMKTSLVAWWDNDEDGNATRVDSAGANDLTATASLQSATIGWDSERSDLRIGRVLDNIGWPSANRDLDTGAATIQALNPVTNTNALTHLQAVGQSENGLIFIQGDGDVEFQNRTARANSPYDTSQATFGEDAGEIGYEDMELSYDDSFIYNEVRLTRTGGTEVVAGDVDSQNAYGKRTLSRTGLLNSTDADVLTVAQTLRNAYKDPAQRIEYIIVDPVANPTNLWAKVLTYDISTRITVRLNEASLDSEFHIEGIEHRFGPAKEWKTKWQLSKAG